MKTKQKNNIGKLGILLVLLLLMVQSVSGFVPLTLAGQKAGCSVEPAYTQHYQNGGKIEMYQSDAMFNFYRVEADGWVFLEEYQKKIDLNKPGGVHYVVEMYDGCDFSELWNPINNGKPDLIESCPAGYNADGNNCVPTEQTRLSTLKNHCLDQGKYWYEDSCHSDRDIGQQAEQAVTDFFRSTMFIMIVWFALIVGMGLVLVKTGLWQRIRGMLPF